MANDTGNIVKFILSILLFPTLFQAAFIDFAWGANDELWVMLSKRLFFLLPVFAIIAGCWISVACALTVVFRHRRREFVGALFITWWDLGKSVASFWGGIFKFALTLAGAIIGLFKIIILGIWFVLQEILFLPFRLLRSAGQNVVSSTVPWIAVFLTLFWCLIEATIFTYVTTPLVVDTFSNITGEQLSGSFVRIPLFIFLFFVVLGSYAVLSTFVDVIKQKKVSTILGIGAIEIVVLFVEVMFLYREFVDSLVPWFAQYSEGFELGAFWTIAIASFTWFGIRSLSWFLFAAHGTPTIMSVIQGKGRGILAQAAEGPRIRFTAFSTDFMDKVKEDAVWIQTKGEELLGAFMLPPLQVVAATINFLMLLISGKHLFHLPFQSLEAIMGTKGLMESFSRSAASSSEG